MYCGNRKIVKNIMRNVRKTNGNERRFDFCTSCRKETSYKMRKKIVPKVIKDKTYEFEIAIAVCEECGKEMDIPGLLDTNIKSIDEQYRQAEGVIN